MNSAIQFFRPSGSTIGIQLGFFAHLSSCVISEQGWRKEWPSTPEAINVALWPLVNDWRLAIK
jgi:hypothetical protein